MFYYRNSASMFSQICWFVNTVVLDSHDRQGSNSNLLGEQAMLSIESGLGVLNSFMWHSVS